MRESISNGECIDHGKRRFLRTADKYQAIGSRAEPVSHTSRSEWGTDFRHPCSSFPCCLVLLTQENILFTPILLSAGASIAISHSAASTRSKPKAGSRSDSLQRYPLSNLGGSHNLRLETLRCSWATQDLVCRGQFAVVSCHLAVLFKDLIKPDSWKQALTVKFCCNP